MCGRVGRVDRITVTLATSPERSAEIPSRETTSSCCHSSPVDSQPRRNGFHPPELRSRPTLHPDSDGRHFHEGHTHHTVCIAYAPPPALPGCFLVLGANQQISQLGSGRLGGPRLDQLFRRRIPRSCVLSGRSATWVPVAQCSRNLEKW